MADSKKHHLVPRVYLKRWIKLGNTLHAINKRTHKREDRNVEKVCVKNDYHTIKAGMQCAEDRDLKIIFKVLENCEIYYNGKKIDKLKEYNNFYCDFNDWDIKNKDGTAVSKKKIKSEIDKVKITEIESLWSEKYEDKWNKIVNIIEQRVKDSKGDTIDKFYKGFIIKWIIAMNLRGYIGSEDINEAFDIFNGYIPLYDIDIPYDERIKSSQKNIEDEIKNDILLKIYREFLNNRGKFYDKARWYIKNINLEFIVADGNEKFVTSDNPSFYKKGNIDKYIMPVTPSILIRFCKLEYGYENKYLISRISEKEVKEYNKLIVNNCYEYYFEY